MQNAEKDRLERSVKDPRYYVTERHTMVQDHEMVNTIGKIDEIEKNDIFSNVTCTFSRNTCIFEISGTVRASFSPCNAHSQIEIINQLLTVKISDQDT